MFCTGIVGLGFVGGAIRSSFLKKKVTTILYDKYKEVGSINDVLDCDFVFLCLPTPYMDKVGFDKSSIYEVCDLLEEKNYKGIVVLKSTVEPGVSQTLSDKYSFLICHNPEFLSAASAEEDFHNQKHIVLGVPRGRGGPDDLEFKKLVNFYSINYPDAEISLCSSSESESMKLFCNNFYAMKIMIFNEFFDLCNKKNINFENVVGLMLKNNWINPMHTKVPGTDGQLAYGGYCFPKDTNALSEFTDRAGTLNRVLKACIFERNILRDD